MNSKATKRSLFASVIALMLCFSMLLGTTFAWFTDTVTSENNIIKSGNLDVEMYWADGKAEPDAATTSWADASTDKIFDYDKWEPGYVEVRHIKIKNAGSLALKYKVAIEAEGEVSDLADVIDVYYKDPAVQVAGRTDVENLEKLGTLTQVLAKLGETGNGELPAGTADTITLAFKMQETAGNEYQNKQIGTAFAVKVYATQLTNESDSFDDQYDANSKYPATTVKASTAEEIKTALSEGNSVVLSKDLALTETLVLDTDAKVMLDLGGNTLSGNEAALIKATAGEITITNGTIKNVKENATETQVSVYLSGNTVAEIKDVTIETSGTGILLDDSAKITNLDATVNSYLNAAKGSCVFDAISISGNAKIESISGGEYNCKFADEIISPYPSSFSHSPSYAIRVADSASIGEISGGTFLGYGHASNGATVYVNGGKIENISGGYFGFFKKTARNEPSALLQVNNGGSIDAITGGTFEKGSWKGFDCDFEGIVSASGCQAVETGTVKVDVQLSTKVTTYTLKVLEVVAK